MHDALLEAGGGLSPVAAVGHHRDAAPGARSNDVPALRKMLPAYDAMAVQR